MVPAPQGEPASRFQCPIAPSTNNLFLNGKLKRGKGPEYMRWLRSAGWTVKLQKPVAVPGCVAVLIEAPLHRRRDVDNCLKATLDLMVSLQIIENDNWIDDLRIVRTSTGVDMTISIWPMGGG